MDKKLHVAIVEPFYAGSHKYWVDRLVQWLKADIFTFTLPGRHWKWRMSASCVQLAEEVNGSNRDFDIFLVTDMLDVASFKGLLANRYQQIPIVLYMHENQVVYPFQTESKDKTWDRHYGLINYKSIRCADHIWFNSQFHLDVFFKEMESFLTPFPEGKSLIPKLTDIKNSSVVVPLGIDIELFEEYKGDKSTKPTVLWNHRWEHDKNPDLFFNSLYELSQQGIDFDLIVCGENFSRSPEVFFSMKKKLAKHIIHWGYFEDRVDYIHALWKSTVLPVTSNQEFFGLSVMEAIGCGVQPILPNRLAYSTLYKESTEIFYQSDLEFQPKLKQVLLGKAPDSYTHLAQNFGWNKVAPTYLNQLTKVLA